MVFLLDAVKIGDKSLAMKRNTGYFQYFQGLHSKTGDRLLEINCQEKEWGQTIRLKEI